ncbi:MAG: AAA family ATPase [Lewinellaceae bacterium]|nr:AAA family ATPase [Lewinellaceae bacterium]
MSQSVIPDLTLFSTSAQTAGFRLESFEVYNWGAFHKTVYSMPVQGENALLTGANGAGKTTLVDALITLLTPAPERFYNQSAGFEDRKRVGERRITCWAAFMGALLLAKSVCAAGKPGKARTRYCWGCLATKTTTSFTPWPNCTGSKTTRCRNGITQPRLP